MSQNRSDQSRIATRVVSFASVLALAGCNPAPNAEKAAAPAAVVATAPAPATVSAPAVSAPRTTGVAAPTPIAGTPSGSVTKPSGQTASATPAKPAAVTAASPQARAPVVTAGLPAGAGREVVQRVCGSCHGIDTVTAVGRTPQQWADIIGQMQNMGLSASDEDLATVHAYLSRELPPK